MPECEICGKNVDTVYEIVLDGSQMLVCEKDARGRGVLNTFGPRQRESRPAGPAPKAPGEPEELVENYGAVIRKAREAIGIPVKVLAERISEKESTLDRIENERTLPSEKTRLKLEKELGIKLLSGSQTQRTFVPTRKSEPPTLWDLAKKKEDEGE